MDQLDPAEPLGPWRLATRIKTAPESVCRRPVTVTAGERLLLGIRYGEAWAEPPAVEVRLLNSGGAVVATAAVQVSGTRGEATLSVPPGGVETLEISYRLDPGSRIPPQNAIVLSMGSGADQQQVVRARHFMWMALDDEAPAGRWMLLRRVTPLELGGRTLDALLLHSGEARSLTVPAALTGRRLRCWYTVLAADPGAAAVVTLETRRAGDWETAARWSVDHGDMGAWTAVPFVEGQVLPRNSDRIRIRVDGGEVTMAISGPLLPAARRPAGRKNLIVIDLDTLRADRMGTYGYTGRPTTGRLDTLLGELGFNLFENAYSPAASTLPATAKFLTGRYHDIHRNWTVPRGYSLLQEQLRQAGYYCVGFTGGGQLRFRGFEQGFHEYSWSDRVGKIEDSFPQALDWLRRNRDELFFLFLHTYETHAPYTRNRFCEGLPRGRLGDVTTGGFLVPLDAGIRLFSEMSPEEQAFIDAAYDSGVRMAADGVADLLLELRQLELLENTVVVILSDHGEEFWDHNQLFAAHGHSLYGELLNVPLIVFDPARPAEGLRRVSEAVSTVDLLPTVLDLLGLPREVETDGVSLAPLMAGGRCAEFHRDLPVLASRKDTSYCVIRDGVKYIRTLGDDPWLAHRRVPTSPDGELFRLTDDPRELNNLVAAEPDLLREMADLLRDAAARALPPLDGEAGLPGATDPGLARQLRALGYIDGE